MNFGTVLGSSTSIEFLTFHDLADIPRILGACKGANQFVRLVPIEGKDLENFTILRVYMVKHEKVSLRFTTPSFPTVPMMELTLVVFRSS